MRDKVARDSAVTERPNRPEAKSSLDAVRTIVPRGSATMPELLLRVSTCSKSPA
jgi:hypothetical protein